MTILRVFSSGILLLTMGVSIWAGNSKDRVHVKIHIPEIVKKHIHTRTVYKHHYHKVPMYHHKMPPHPHHHMGHATHLEPIINLAPIHAPIYPSGPGVSSAANFDVKVPWVPKLPLPIIPVAPLPPKEEPLISTELQGTYSHSVADESYELDSDELLKNNEPEFETYKPIYNRPGKHKIPEHNHQDFGFSTYTSSHGSHGGSHGAHGQSGQSGIRQPEESTTSSSYSHQLHYFPSDGSPGSPGSHVSHGSHGSHGHNGIRQPEESTTSSSYSHHLHYFPSDGSHGSHGSHVHSGIRQPEEPVNIPKYTTPMSTTSTSYSHQLHYFPSAGEEDVAVPVKTNSHHPVWYMSQSGSTNPGQKLQPAKAMESDDFSHFDNILTTKPKSVITKYGAKVPLKELGEIRRRIRKQKVSKKST